MTEHESGALEADEVVIARFQEILDQIPTLEGEFLRGLIGQRQIRLTTDDSFMRIIRAGRSDGVVGFSVCHDPKTSSSKAVIAIDAKLFNSKGPRALEGQVRDISEKFYHNRAIAKRANLEWQFLEDSEVPTFLAEAATNRGNGYEVFNLTS